MGEYLGWIGIGMGAVGLVASARLADTIRTLKSVGAQRDRRLDDAEASLRWHDIAIGRIRDRERAESAGPEAAKHLQRRDGRRDRLDDDCNCCGSA